MNATPVASPVAAFDPDVVARIPLLPAMALSASDLPDGFRLLGERFETSEGVSAFIIHGHSDAAKLGANGFVTHYESAYLEADGNLVIRSWVALFANSSAASASYKIVGTPRRLQLPSGSEAAYDVDNIGDGKAMAGGAATTGIRGNRVNAADISLRIDNMLAGITLEKPGHGPAPSEEEARALATALEARIREALAGETATRVDLRLARAALPLQRIATATLVQDGYLDRIDVVGTGGADGFVSSYVRAATLLQDAANPSSRPWVGLIVTTFDSAEVATAFATHRVSSWADEGGAMEQLPDVANADWLAAMSSSSRRPGAGSERAWRLMAVAGDRVVVIETDGFSRDEWAVALLEAQLACLGSDEICMEVPEA